MKFPLAVVGLLSLTALTASAQTHSEPKTPLPPQTPVVPFGEEGKNKLMMKDLMRYLINPAAEEFWQWGGEVDGKLRTPTNDKEWYAALEAAATIVETSNLLMSDPRAQADPNWAKWTADLNKAGVHGVKATQAKDGDGTFAAGSEMFDACLACHYKYIRREPQRLAPLPEIPADFFTKPAP